jgi:hypothetical protein
LIINELRRITTATHNWGFVVRMKKYYNANVAFPKSCQNTATGSVFLRASEEIELKGEFTVPIGSVFYLGVNPCY